MLRIVVRRIGGSNKQGPAFPTVESIGRAWARVTTPARDICEEGAKKSVWLRQKVFVPFGNKLANLEQQVSAMLEKDPHTKRMAQQQTVYLSQSEAITKSSDFFAQLITALVGYYMTKIILSMLFGFDSNFEGQRAKEMRENELVEINRDIAGLRQELKILHMERNKWRIEIQKLQGDVTLLNESNRKLAKQLENQEDTINLVKKNIVL